MRKRFTIVLLSFLTFFSITLFAGQQRIIKKGNAKYLSNTLVIKLKSTPSANFDGTVFLSPSLTSSLSQFGMTSASIVFPGKAGQTDNGLGKIITVTYSSDFNPVFVASKIINSPEVEWAEPRFIYEPVYTPNDPNFGSQWNLSKIKATLAWDVTKGDTNVVIGIVDTGVDWDHPDLSANIWINYNEIPNNGIDDDNNGFVDDVRGWDFGGLHGTPDNDPMEDRPDHGTHVAGIASAVTDNATGIASIGFNSKIMAVKTTIDDQRGPNGPFIIFGFEGIVYAADNGAKVINCSWGGGGYSIFGQETIDYAISKGALVVCAAGNNSSSAPFYPAWYNGVLSVASTNSSDLKSGFSNYGTDVDVSSPGSSIFSTWMNNTYATLSGTSMASPLAAGLAALVFAQFPDYTPLQVGEQVRVNSDNIDGLNSAYTNLIGFGRINAQNAVSNTNSISVRALDFTFSDEAPGGDGDGVFEPGETISLTGHFINYLNSTSGLQISLESKNNFSTVVNGTFSAGAHGTLEEFDNSAAKFTFTLSNSLPQNADLKFLVHYSDGSYQDYQWTSTIGNPTYATQSGNNVAMTITSKGTFGYNDYPDNLQGAGFTYLGGSNLMFEGALILGTSANQISDAARGDDQSVQDNDFSVMQPFILSIPGENADIEGSAVFNDNNAGSNKIGIETHFHSYTFTSTGDENYIILDYMFINTNSSAVNNLYAGLFFDWDFADATSDQTAWDSTGHFGYVYRPSGSPDNYVGLGLISSEDYGFWAIKNDGGDGGFQIYDGFDDGEKWQAISSGIGKSTAGPGDISHVVSAGAFNIPAGDTIRVSFAVMGADDIAGLRDAIASARTKFEIITDVKDIHNNEITPKVFALEQNYPNPFNPSTKIRYTIGTPLDPPFNKGGKFGGVFVNLKVYDVLGSEVATLVNENKTPGSYEVTFNASNFPSGVYFYQLRAGAFVQTKKMILLR